jgi:hypothetical protein
MCEGASDLATLTASAHELIPLLGPNRSHKPDFGIVGFFEDRERGRIECIDEAIKSIQPQAEPWL